MYNNIYTGTWGFNFFLNRGDTRNVLANVVFFTLAIVKLYLSISSGILSFLSKGCNSTEFSSEMVVIWGFA